jgi:hypothetical protein
MDVQALVSAGVPPATAEGYGYEVSGFRIQDRPFKHSAIKALGHALNCCPLWAVAGGVIAKYQAATKFCLVNFILIPIF